MKLFKRFLHGDPLRKAVRKEDIDKVYNILENIKGVNCEIKKDPLGLNWSIEVNGKSDTEIPEGINPPWGSDQSHQYQPDGVSTAFRADTPNNLEVKGFQEQIPFDNEEATTPDTQCDVLIRKPVYEGGVVTGYTLEYVPISSLMVRADSNASATIKEAEGNYNSLSSTDNKSQISRFTEAVDESNIHTNEGVSLVVRKPNAMNGADVSYSSINRYLVQADGNSLAQTGATGELPSEGSLHTLGVAGWDEQDDESTKPTSGAVVVRTQKGGEVNYVPIDQIGSNTALDDKSLAYTGTASPKAEIKGFATESSTTNLDLGGDIVMRKEDKTGIHFINHTAFAPRADGISLTSGGSGEEYATQISGFDSGADTAQTPHKDGARFLLRVPSGDSAYVDYCPMEKYAVGADGESLQMNFTDVADSNGTNPPFGQTCHELAINGWNNRNNLTEKPSSGSILIRPELGGKVQYLPLDLLGVALPDGTYKFVTDISWTGQTLTKKVDTWVVVDGVVTITHGTSETVFAATVELA